MLPLRRGEKKLYCIFLNITIKGNYVTQQHGVIEETLFPVLQPVAFSLYWQSYPCFSECLLMVNIAMRDHQCDFRRNRSTIDHIFCIRQILEKKWEYNEEVHQLFIDFKKAYDSVRRQVLYKILIEFGIPRKLVKLIKMSLTWTYSRVRVGKMCLTGSRIELLETRRRSNATSFQLCFRVRHYEGSGF